MNNIIETIGFSTGLDALDKSKQFGHVLVNTLAASLPCLSQGCPSMQTTKRWPTCCTV